MTNRTRVLYISYNGATEPVANSQVMPYLKGLAAKGYEIDLLTFEKKESVLRKAANAAILKKELDDSGIRWLELRYHKSPTLLATAFDILCGIVYSAYRIVRRRYDIVHARQVVPAAMCVMLKPFFKIRWIFDMRGLVAEEYVGHGAWKEGDIKFRLVKWFEKKALMSADHIVVLTRRHKEAVESLPYMARKDTEVSVIPCCVDTARFTPVAEDFRKEAAKRLGLPNGFILLYLGSLGTCYFLDEMLRFFKKLKERDPEAMFLFLTNYDAAEIAAKAQTAGVEKDSVRVMFAEPSEVHRWVAQADAGIYFINTYKKFGSCPIKTGEYLASGLPIVINAGIGDGDSFVKERKIGVVVEDFNDREYEGALGKLFSLLKEDGIRDRCRRSAEESMSLSYGLDLYNGIYKSICRI